VNARPAGLTGAPEGPVLLARLRDRLLGRVLGLLEADPVIAGVALVGSLGRGEEDNWSDIDLFILASDQFIRQFMNEPAASPWARADLLSDGRHNSPAGATSLGTTHIRSGLPLWVDLHVHPADRTPWPTDSHVVFERRPVKTGTLSFGEFNARGPRQPATAKTTDEVRQIHLGYVPIAGKYVGRQSPRACDMIRFLGRRDFNDRDPAAQIRALRDIAKDLSSPSWGQLCDAVTSYLDLVEATIQQGGEQGKLVQRSRSTENATPKQRVRERTSGNRTLEERLQPPARRSRPRRRPRPRRPPATRPTDTNDVAQAVRTLLGRTAGLAVGARGPVVCCPLRPARPARRRARDLSAIEFSGVRHLELVPPRVQVSLAHREGLVRCRFLAVRDPGELDVLVHG
jgi:Nucleotidyltransferase domain